MSDLNYTAKQYAATQNGKYPAAGWVVRDMFDDGRVVKTFPKARFNLHILKAKLVAAWYNSTWSGENVVR